MFTFVVAAILTGLFLDVSFAQEQPVKNIQVNLFPKTVKEVIFEKKTLGGLFANRELTKIYPDILRSFLFANRYKPYVARYYHFVDEEGCYHRGFVIQVFDNNQSMNSFQVLAQPQRDPNWAPGVVGIMDIEPSITGIDIEIMEAKRRFTNNEGWIVEEDLLKGTIEPIEKEVKIFADEKK